MVHTSSFELLYMFIHLNTRSLLPKLDELRLLAANTKVAVIGITESWLDASVTDAEVEIPGYLIVRHDRNRTGGGVCISGAILPSTPRMTLAQI